jgi:hypothetical protein
MKYRLQKNVFGSTPSRPPKIFPLTIVSATATPLSLDVWNKLRVGNKLAVTLTVS